MIAITQTSTGMSANASFESLSPRPCSVEDEIHEGFGGHAENPPDEEMTYLEGPCFLKTRTDRFKDHWAVLKGNEIFCYRSKEDTRSRVMHSLAGTFSKELEPEVCPFSNRSLYPVKIVLPPNKSRVLYFGTIEQQKEWSNMLLKAMGFSNLFDYYDLGRTLGKG